MRVVLILLALAAVGVAVSLTLRRAEPPPLPSDLQGTLVFISDRTGIDAVFLRKLPNGPDLRLTHLGEPAKEPALSPDGQHVAFVAGGRIAVVAVATGDVRYLSLGVAAKDRAPDWFPDGNRLAIVSRPALGENADLFELAASGGAAESPRRRLLETASDESEPVVSPDGESIVFVREDNLHRLELKDGRVRKLTGGFHKTRGPRFLPSGRIVCLWSQDKQFGIDVLDGDGKKRETLSQGSTFYRSLAPSPDGRYLAATYAFDLGFHPSEVVTRRKNQELRLLSARATPVVSLSEGWRYSNHSPAWGR